MRTECQSRLARFLILCALSLGTSQSTIECQSASIEARCEAYRDKKPPRYRVARRIIRKGSANSAAPTENVGELYVSVAPADFERDKLLSLGCQLGYQYSSQQSLFVWIFDDHHAAKHFNPQGEGNDRRTNLARRALYGFSRNPGPAFGQSLDWQPDRADPKVWVHIDLGPPPPLPPEKPGAP